MALPSVRPAKVTWTYADYRLLPDDGKRYEVIDGDMLVTPAPSTAHQKVSKRIQFELMLQIEKRGQGVIFNAPVDLIFSETRSVQPDLVAIRAERAAIVTERGIEGAPDLVIEILSPRTEAADRELKRKLYASEGVAEYWIVDPEAGVIEVHELKEDGYALLRRCGPGSTACSAVFELAFDVDPIFAEG